MNLRTRLYIVDKNTNELYFNSDFENPQMIKDSLCAWSLNTGISLRLDSKDPSRIWVMGIPNLPNYWIGYVIVTHSPLAAAIILQMWKETKARR